MRLVDRNDEKIIYSDNGLFLTEYVLITGDKGVGINSNCISYDYLFIVDKRYNTVVGMVEGASKFSPENKDMLQKIKKQIEYYEKSMLDNDNEMQFLLETELKQF